MNWFHAEATMLVLYIKHPEELSVCFAIVCTPHWKRSVPTVTHSHTDPQFKKKHHSVILTNKISKFMISFLKQSKSHHRSCVILYSITYSKKTFCHILESILTSVDSLEYQKAYHIDSVIKENISRPVYSLAYLRMITLVY